MGDKTKQRMPQRMLGILFSETHTQHNNHQNMNVTQNNSMHPYGLNAAAAGLSLPDLINMNTKVARYDELKDNHFNLKNDFDALKKENDSLVRELGKKRSNYSYF